MIPGGDFPCCAPTRSRAPEPAELSLSAAAAVLLQARSDRNLGGGAGSAYYGALDLWEALTGLTGDAALTYAQTVAARPTTAVLPPF